jgi:hypothetical protein
MQSGKKNRAALLGLGAALMCSTALIPSMAEAASLPKCSGLAALLLKETGIAAATSVIVPAASPNLAYCLVNITVSELSGPKDGYLPGQSQMINVGIGLPLSTADGGSGGTLGAWNERIQDLGGGGYAGTVGPVTSATNNGFVGSSTDTGHPASEQGFFALNSPPVDPTATPPYTLNFGLIRDFAINGIHQQAIWTKSIAQMYYGRGPKFTYWNGCSTGGRQGHEQAQMFPDDFDGILAGAPAFNWDRFIVAEQWGQIVMNQELGTQISNAKLSAANTAAIAACDLLDGVADGVIQDPRACTFDAKSLECSVVPSDPNCLTAAEADSVNKIWNGPPGPKAGERLWFGLERGTEVGLFPAGTTFLDAPPPFGPFSISTQYLQYWVNQNPNFNWQTITETTFADQFKTSELKFHDVIGTDNPNLFAFRDHGGKMIIYHGLADELIFPRGSFNYYNRVTERMGGLTEVQKFYRFFPYPGNNHCGGNATMPNAPLINGTDLFNALLNWVEHGVAPDSIVAYNAPTLATATVVRPVCKYPDKLVYDGVGSIDVESSFVCKHETTDPLMSAEDALPDPGAH